jgi:membrane-bound lytic murein transglycosylase D
VKRLLLIVILAGIAHSALGQNDALSLDDLMRSAEQWANENLDDDALRVLQSGDQKEVKKFFDDIEKQFHGEYVIDLAPLKDTARTLEPLLERYQETQPYALWLKTRLDYLEVADQFRLIIPAPKPSPGQPPRPTPNPPPRAEQEMWVQKLAGRPPIKSAPAYVTRLKPIFAAQKVPPELIWIAEVESSFDPRARSPQGAAGLFQLMPATAKQYGLRTWPFDSRLSPDESAQAAAKYLRHLHGHFNDWRLALAAYNAGEGTVDKLLAHHKSHSFESIASQLPAETQMFVPKVEATVLRREGPATPLGSSFLSR